MLTGRENATKSAFATHPWALAVGVDDGHCRAAVPMHKVLAQLARKSGKSSRRDFDVVDRTETHALRKRFNLDATPWRVFLRIIASYHYLRQDDIREEFLD